MKWTGLNELREKFLSFFEGKQHLRLKSFSLVPDGDNSLLLINSGMAPMKKYFTGEVTPPRKRVTTCQKCIRTPDIERVGITARHGTYFEMLGNFSFGDYFKRDATSWAWEFCTKVLELPIDRLWVSIYEDDDEAFKIWTQEIGVSADRVVRLGKADNFWEHGAGPCGPCSEIYFDRGEKYGCGASDCGVGCECDRYIEFWNLVFTQFSSDGQGNYTPLENPNIDTGMGLERLACIMQEVDNLFLVDTVQNIMQHICRIANKKYGESEKTDISLRVVTDHIRSTTFMLSDGILPSNEGRGYVLRRLLRRAARHGRLLGIKRPFLSDVCDTVIAENCHAYPELTEKRDFIKNIIATEEDSFSRTIDQGLQMLANLIDNADFSVLSGEEAFKLNDTFGFPLDLTKEIAAEHGMTVDEDTFKRLLARQKERARAARKNLGADAWKNGQIDLSSLPETEFVGYERMSANAQILAIIKGDALVDSAADGEEITIVLDRTPFYAEGGGQVGDVGVISVAGASLDVISTTKSPTGVYLHGAVVKSGSISLGTQISAQVDEKNRRCTMRNHTAAHLLQAALRQVLGTHVEQAGQLVNDRQVRFDFTHFSALTREQLAEVETLVNEQILRGVEVENFETTIKEAKSLGAMALFGEKYGEIVRVVKAGDFSVELCGGTHVQNTANLGLFKIVYEGSVASGVRRIEAVTGQEVLALLDKNIAINRNCAASLKLSNTDELPQRCSLMQQELKEKDRHIEKLQSKIAAMQIDNLLGGAKELGSVCLVAHDFSRASGDIAYTPEILKSMCDKIKDKNPRSVIVLAGKNSDKLFFVAAVGKDALKSGAHAGKIVKEVAKAADGNGGGKPDMAMAGAKNEGKIKEALGVAERVLLEISAT